MRRRLVLICIGMAGLLAPVSRAEDAKTVPKEYKLPEVGTLRLAIPDGWRDQFKKTLELGTRVDEVKLLPAAGRDFAVTISAIHMDAQKAREIDPHEVLAEAGKSELAASVEQSLDIHDFKGPEASGSYFSLTDANPKQGDFKYLTQGYAKLGTVVLSFRLVSNRPGWEERPKVVELIRAARLTASK